MVKFYKNVKKILQWKNLPSFKTFRKVFNVYSAYTYRHSVSNKEKKSEIFCAAWFFQLQESEHAIFNTQF